MQGASTMVCGMSEPIAKERDPLAELARRAGSGDRASCSLLLRKLGPALLRTVRRMIGSAPELDDVLQESMLGVLAALPAFRGESSVERYAIRIAVRTTIASRKRARERRGKLDEHVREHEPLEATVSTPAEEALAARRRAVLRELLSELPEAQAETMALRVVLDYSLEEVAEATGAPINTVRSRMRLAREALRARIESDPALLHSLEVAE